MISRKRPFILYLAAASFAISFGMGQASLAAPLQRFAIPVASDFQQALLLLADKGHVVLIAEGVPLHPHLSPADATKLAMPQTLDDEIKAVATAYDYSVQRTGNVFVLKKRYSDVDDLPALTPAECERTLALLPQVVDAFNPHSPPDRVEFITPLNPQASGNPYRVTNLLVNSFASSLTSGELDAMHKNKLFVSSLLPEQRAMARRVLLYLYVQEPIERVASLSPKLTRTEEDAVFVWQNADPYKHLFGYTLPQQQGDQSQKRFHPLSQFTAGEEMDIPVVSTQKPTGPDLTELPLILSRGDIGTAQTLRDAVATINLVAGNRAQTRVDDSVAMKPVTTAGIANAPADQVLHALADMYGLRTSTLPPGGPITYTLTMPDAPPLSDIAGVPASLRQALPEPFVRAAHLDEMVDEASKAHDFWLPPVIAPPSQAKRPPSAEETPEELERAKKTRLRALGGLKEILETQERIKLAQAALPALRISAIRRLRTLVEPRLKAKPAGVALATLGEAEHEALATIFLVDASQSLIKLLAEPMSDSLVYFDHDVLSGGITGQTERPMFSVFYNTGRSDGRVLSGPGIGGLDYVRDYKAKP